MPTSRHLLRAAEPETLSPKEFHRARSYITFLSFLYIYRTNRKIAREGGESNIQTHTKKKIKGAACLHNSGLRSVGQTSRPISSSRSSRRPIFFFKEKYKILYVPYFNTIIIDLTGCIFDFYKRREIFFFLMLFLSFFPFLEKRGGKEKKKRGTPL